MNARRCYLFGPFEFDGRLLRRDGKRVALSDRETRALALLLERHRSLVPREDLIEAMGAKFNPAILDIVISKLRARIGDRLQDSAGGRYTYIDTHVGRGYSFEHEVRMDEAVGNDPESSFGLGLKRWNDRDSSGLFRAKQLFERTLELAPRFGAAHAAQADCYAILGSYGWKAPRKAATKAKALARGALALDRGLAQPYATLGFVHALFEHDWSNAGREFARSLRHAPDYATAHHWYALYLAAQGDAIRALEAIAAAYERDPLSRIIAVHAGLILYWAGELEAARDQCEDSIQNDPEFWYAHHLLGLLYEAQGCFDRALEKQRDALAHDPGSPLIRAAQARALALCGAQGEARKQLLLLRALPAGRAADFHVAAAYAALGDRNAAFAHLALACERSDVWVSFATLDPRFAELRTDRRFTGLQRALRLPATRGMGRERLPRRRLARALRRLDL